MPRSRGRGGTAPPRSSRWALWSELDLSTRETYRLTPPRAVAKLPAAAELSGDGNWATVYRVVNGREVATAVYVNLGPAEVVRRQR